MATDGVETEVKFCVRNLRPIETRLLELKAQLIQPRVHETNLRFDFPDGSLRKGYKVLRLRKDTGAKFTYKGPSQERQDGVLCREEIEFSVGDFDEARKFLELLGYIPVVFYEKFRTTYEYQNVHIMLDELPYGTFVELEGDHIQTLREIADQLRLNWDAMVKAGYHALFERAAQKFHLDPGDLSFKALESVSVTAADLEITPAD